MKLTRVLLASFALALPTYAAAFADTFTFSFGSASDVFAGSGVLTATAITDSTSLYPTYLITDISGVTRTTRNGNDIQIASLDARGTTVGSQVNDNLLFEVTPGDFEVDNAGFSYALANTAQVNISSAFLGFLDSEVLIRTNGTEVNESAPYTIAATPEPGSLVLLGTGMLGVLGAARRRFSV